MNIVPFLLSLFAIKRDIAVTILLRCMCMHVCMHACLCPGFVWVVALTFMHGFQNDLTQLLFLG